MSDSSSICEKYQSVSKNNCSLQTVGHRVPYYYSKRWIRVMLIHPAQSSIFSPSTLWNSLVLFVTKTRLSDLAWPAIRRSRGLMGVPFFQGQLLSCSAAVRQFFNFINIIKNYVFLALYCLFTAFLFFIIKWITFFTDSLFNPISIKTYKTTETAIISRTLIQFENSNI